MATTQHVTTAEELLQASGLGRCELVRGELHMMSPAGFEHGRIAGRIHVRLAQFVESRGLGLVLSSDTGFYIQRDPDTVRAPDVGFVRTERVPRAPAPGFFEGPPDLAVEVLSPGDRAGEVLAKIQDWLDAGCKAVWVVDPAAKTIVVYRPGGTVVRLAPADDPTAEDILPGFRLRVGGIFA
ncbi:MAG: Uma2 family endonuclease [Thermoguttaceae bacterium]|jgi:Uma2 family endonuclease